MPGYIKDRTLGIGGSDVGAMLGLSRYSNAKKLYHEKRKELPGEEPPSNEEGKMFGKLCEAIAARMFYERTGRKVWRPGRTIRHPAYKYMLANPDRFEEDPARVADGRGVVEIKWLDASRRRIWINEGVPEGYYLQLQHYLMVTGYRWGTFVVVFGGNKLEFFDVARDEAVIDRLLEVEIDFWNRVQQGNPPDNTFDELGLALVKRMYPTQQPGKEMILDNEEAFGRVRRWFALRERIDALTADETAIEVWLKEQIGDAEKVLIPGLAEFTWKAQSSSRIDTKKLKAEHPAIAAACLKESSSRVLRSKDLRGVLPDDEQPLVLDEMISVGAPQAARRLAFDE